MTFEVLRPDALAPSPVHFLPREHGEQHLIAQVSIQALPVGLLPVAQREVEGIGVVLGEGAPLVGPSKARVENTSVNHRLR